MWRRADDTPHVARHAWSGELLILAAVSIFLGVIGPFGTDDVPLGVRYAYWLFCIVGGGTIGIFIDRLSAIAVRPIPLRVLLVASMMTPLVTAWVLVGNHFFLGDEMGRHVFQLAWQVFVISLPLMTVRALVHRPPVTNIETRTIVEAPLPEVEAAFRRRLSAKRRYAALIAIEAHDHYLRVHTDQGAELVTMRFVDALTELERAAGYRVHRSWWIAASAIESVSWSRGSGNARLANGVVAPVSRSFSALLREAGWR